MSDCANVIVECNVKERSFYDHSFEARLSILDYDLQIWKSCKTKALVGIFCRKEHKHTCDVMFALTAVKVPIFKCVHFVLVFHEVSPQ